MQTGEVLRRVVFNLLDAAKGGRLKKLKEVNKREIVEESQRNIWNAGPHSSGLCKGTFSLL